MKLCVCTTALHPAKRRACLCHRREELEKKLRDTGAWRLMESGAEGHLGDGVRQLIDHHLVLLQHEIEAVALSITSFADQLANSVGEHRFRCKRSGVWGVGVCWLGAAQVLHAVATWNV